MKKNYIFAIGLIITINIFGQSADELERYMKYKDSAPKTDKSLENEEWNNEIYRNNKYKFRIQFPKKWEYDKGTAKHTLARALNRKRGIVILVGVTELSEKIQYPNDITKIMPIEAYKSDLMKKLFEIQNIPIENIGVEKGYLNNFPAYITEYLLVSSSGTNSSVYLSKQINCLYNSKIYSLGINIPVSEWNKNTSRIFDRCISSFNFELAY